MSNTKKARTLNAISPCQPPQADERTSRHLRLCAELADLAMQLARAAAARTLADWAEPEAPATAPPGAAGTASPKQTDPAILFTRFAAVVRDCVALEARIAAGAAPTPRAASLVLRADPRRAPLREAFRHATIKHPDHADLLRATTTRLDEHLAADTEQTTAPPHLFATICTELGIAIDLATLPDEYLNALYEATNPDPRATSPP
jgi:hypothetical protein